MIFPYVRKIIADVTQDGGFQPLMIDPVDFGVLYSKKMMQDGELYDDKKKH
jgi:preprotein translocase subunit SecB